MKSVSKCLKLFLKKWAFLSCLVIILPDPPCTVAVVSFRRKGGGVVCGTGSVLLGQARKPQHTPQRQEHRKSHSLFPPPGPTTVLCSAPLLLNYFSPGGPGGELLSSRPDPLAMSFAGDHQLDAAASVKTNPSQGMTFKFPEGFIRCRDRPVPTPSPPPSSCPPRLKGIGRTPFLPLSFCSCSRECEPVTSKHSFPIASPSIHDHRQKYQELTLHF